MDHFIITYWKLSPPIYIRYYTIFLLIFNSYYLEFLSWAARTFYNENEKRRKKRNLYYLECDSTAENSYS